jgi:putative endonuclease
VSSARARLPRSGVADRRRAIGQVGEDLACEHLTRRGFAIVDRNVRTRYGEIDVIARGGNTIVFVEVKTRSARVTSPQPVPPLDGLKVAQRLRLRRLAAAWLSTCPAAARGTTEFRFDAVGILVDGAGRLVRLDHIENAW